MKKITFVTYSLSSGGAERVISILSNNFVSRGYDIDIIKIFDEPSFYNLDRKIKVHTIGKKSKNKLINKFKIYLLIRKKIKVIKPDIIVSLPEEIAIYLLLFTRGLRIPIIVSERNNPYVMPNKKITRLLRKIAYRFSQGFVFQTQNAAMFFNKKIQNKSIVIGNPLDTNKLPEPYLGERVKEIVTVGRLVPQKNNKLLIRAFYNVSLEYTDIKLGIYGAGESEEELKKLVIDLKLNDKVSFYGRKQDILEEIKNKYIFVLTSDFEGVPNALLESLAIGLPSISTDCPPGGPRSLIENNINGILVPVNDETKLTEELIRLIRDKELREKFSKNAVKIRNSYDIDTISEKWINYINYIYYKNRRK